MNFWRSKLLWTNRWGCSVSTWFFKTWRFSWARTIALVTFCFLYVLLGTLLCSASPKAAQNRELELIRSTAQLIVMHSIDSNPLKTPDSLGREFCLYASVTFCVLAILTVLPIPYFRTWYLLVNSGQGGHGDSEGIAVFLLSIIAFALTSFAALFRIFRAEWRVGMKVLLAGALSPIVLIWLSSAFVSATFALLPKYFCSQQVLETNRSPTLNCICRLKKVDLKFGECGGWTHNPLRDRTR